MSKLCNEQWDQMTAGHRIVTCAHFIADLTLVLEYFDFDSTIVDAVEAVLNTQKYSKFNEYLMQNTDNAEQPLHYAISEVADEVIPDSNKDGCI